MLILIFCQILVAIGTSVTLSASSILALRITGLPELAGLTSSITIIGSALMAAPLGLIASRWGRRVSLSVGYLVGGMGLLAIVLSSTYNSYLLLAFGVFIFGMAGAASLQARYAGAELAPNGKQGLFIGIVLWASTISVIAGPLVLATAGGSEHGHNHSPHPDVNNINLGIPFFIASVAAGCAAILALFFPRQDNDRIKITQNTLSWTSRLSAGLATLRTAEIWAAAGPMIIAYAVMMSVMSFTALHLYNLGKALDFVGLAMTAHLLAMYAFSPLFGWLSGRIGPAPVIIAGSVTLLVALIIGFCGYQNAWMVVLTLVLVGFGWSAMMTAGSTAITMNSKKSTKAITQSITDMLMYSLTAILAAVSGFLYSRVGFQGLALVFCLLPMISILCGVILLKKMHSKYLDAH